MVAMKKIIAALPACIIISIQAFSQSSVGMRNEFKQISSLGRKQTGFEGLQTYRLDKLKN
jgi:hypothetical protein